MSNILVEVQFYRKLREGFGLFCRTAGNVLSSHFEDYELKFSPGTGPSRTIFVLEHECRVRFGVMREGGRETLVGRLLFERVLGAEKAEFLFETTFDHLLNVVRQPLETRRTLRIDDPEFIRSFMAATLLDRMLTSLSAEQPERPADR
jgi:hypothetical protein